MRRDDRHWRVQLHQSGVSVSRSGVTFHQVWNHKTFPLLTVRVLTTDRAIFCSGVGKIFKMIVERATPLRESTVGFHANYCRNLLKCYLSRVGITPLAASLGVDTTQKYPPPTIRPCVMNIVSKMADRVKNRYTLTKKTFDVAINFGGTL